MVVFLPQRLTPRLAFFLRFEIGSDDYLSPTLEGRNWARSFRAESTNPKSSIFSVNIAGDSNQVEENNQPNRYQHLE